MESKALSSIPSPDIIGERQDFDLQKFGGNSFLPAFLKNFKLDDIILIAIIVLLLMDENTVNDKLLIGVLVFILITGFEGNIFGLF